ncbi:MAG: M48 family metalloprotease [Pseudomonadota bacterium]
MHRNPRGDLFSYASPTLLLTGLLLLGGLLGGCSTNPVTGKRNFNIVSEPQELQIGSQQYGPSRQMQGGDYVTDPALVNYVKAVGQKVAAHSDRDLPYQFEVLNNGVPNAWALPGGKIAINRGLLLEMQTEAELAAVLGHEVVHAAASHGALAMSRGMLLQGAVLATAVASRDSDYSRYAVGGASIAAQLVNQKYGRGAELESDEYGIKYMAEAGYDPQGAVELQKTFVRLSEGRRTDFLSGLFASHPPSQERVEKNIATANAIGRGGKVGREEYQRAVAGLKQRKPAYDAFDDGRKALADGNPVQATALAEKAIRLEPREAHFYGLKGDVAFADKNYRSAVRQYSAALERNPEYFKFYLGRGESYRQLNQLDAAERDLKASANLLPTADAANALGLIAERRGQVDTAIGYYEMAASSQTPAGRQSNGRLVMLDLPRRPERYIAVQTRVDTNGRVFAEIGNRTQVPVTNVTVALAYRDSAGRVRQEQRVFRGRLESARTAMVAIGTQPYASALNTMQLKVVSAQPIQ